MAAHRPAGGVPVAPQVIRGAALVAAPWKNGGGVTREVAAQPPAAGLDAFVWRVSVADVAAAGPFSRFPGIDRTLVLLSGAGMLLDEEGGTTRVLREPLSMARFAGEVAIDARLVDGPTRDFNLMVRRGHARGQVEVWRGAGEHALSLEPAATMLLFCASDLPMQVSLGADAPLALARDDSVRLDGPCRLSCRVEGEGALLAVRIEVA